MRDELLGLPDMAKVEISSHFNAKQQAFLDFVLAHYVDEGVQELDQDKLTPLFKQYTSIKDEQPGLLLYRLGDFYEMFGPDAVRGAELLGLTLTNRACHQGYKVAMCGIPHHAGARYIKRL